jgi:molybdenum cofactor cytidylyltransferase
MAIQGDIGARNLIAHYSEAVTEVPVTGNAAFTDVDTPESFSAVKAEIESVQDSNH